MKEWCLRCFNFFEPQKSYRGHLVAISVDFQQQYVKIYAEKVLLNACNSKCQIPFCLCIVRTWDNVRLKALTLRYVLNISIMGVGSLENFLRPRNGLGLTFFWLDPLTLPKSRNFWESKKWILVVKMIRKI